MTQLEVGTYHFTHTSEGTNYIDLTKSDTLANCKNKQQFKNGRPLGYVVTARFSNAANEIQTIPTGWVQTNSLVKASAAWRKMYQKAGLSKKDLNTYGRELRLPMTKAHRENWGNEAHDIIADGLPSDYRTQQYNSDGDVITVYATTDGSALIGVEMQNAFDLTTITIPSPDGSAGDAIDWSPFVLADGTSNADKLSSVLYQYVTSRGSQEVEDKDIEDSQGMESSNYLIQALSDNEETSDDVIDNVKDLGDFRPYSLENQIQARTKAVAAGTNVAGQDTSFIAPCGLIEWTGSENDVLTLTVSAIVEM